MPPPSLHTSKITNIEPLSPSDAKWISLQKITYLDPHSTPRTWESCSRPTRPSTSTIDSVGIVAILRYPQSCPSPSSSTDLSSSDTSAVAAAAAAPVPRIVLQKQFRPPAGKIVIEIPAGLVDEGETPEQCAVRELREETGYVGVVDKEAGWGVSPVMFGDPGLSSTTLRMLHLNIDLSDPANQHPVPSLAPDEFIETFDLPLRDLWAACGRFEREGYGIDARVATLAEGIEGARRWGVWG